jgi:hypothetical protein
VLMLLELDKEDDIMLFLLMCARALRGGVQCWAALLELDVRRCALDRCGCELGGVELGRDREDGDSRQLQLIDGE